MITWRKIMIDASKYTITVRKDVFDGEECFEARIAEFPDICEYGDSFDEAYNLAIDSIETSALLLQEQGKSIPTPIIPADNYSGRVTLRLPKSLHRALVHAADNEGISLNQHLTNVLNYYTGYAQANAVQ
jgi:predicted HicB family RNase H-like nuclease